MTGGCFMAAAARLPAALGFVIIGSTMLAVALLIGLAQHRNHSDDSDGSDAGGGGGKVRRNRPPRGPTGGGEPAWWPTFEREFADYVARARALEVP